VLCDGVGNMTVLVTGGTGFLGSYVLGHIADVAPEETVVAFDRYPNPEHCEGSGARLIAGDILEIQELVSTVNQYRVDTIIHLAYLPGGIPNKERLVPYLRVQCMGTANVLEAARICGIQRVVNASSSAVYGRRTAGPFTEDDPVDPDEIYGACKVWGEQVSQLYMDQHGIDVFNLRLGGSIGYGRLGRASLQAGLHSDRGTWMAAPEIAARTGQFPAPQDSVLFDFIHAADTAAAFWAAATVPHATNRVFNVCGPRHAAGEMTALLRELLPGVKVDYAAEYKHVPLLDNARLIAELGFAPKYDLRAGVTEYVRTVQQKVDTSEELPK
jgi:nucleoside-diphosphate-sugar epimerase